MDNLNERNCWLLAENIRFEINRRPKADVVGGKKTDIFIKW